MYNILATIVVYTIDDTGVEWHSTQQIPSFQLDGNLLGLLTENYAAYVAEKMLASIIDATNPGNRYELHVHAGRL